MQLREAWRKGSGGWGCKVREPRLIINEEGPPMGMTEDLDEAQAEADRWNSKGNAYLAVKDYITAISCFNLALKTRSGSDNADIYLSNRATALFRIGEYQAAVEGFREASDLRPDKYSHFICLGKVYLRWGGHEAEALEALTSSLRLEHTTVAANLAAKAKAALEESCKDSGAASTTKALPSRSIKDDTKRLAKEDGVNAADIRKKRTQARGEDGEAFPSPLTTLAEDARRKNSRWVASPSGGRVSLRGSSVAKAAIAAGAAPVKWGREGAIERATKRKDEAKSSQGVSRRDSFHRSNNGNYVGSNVAVHQDQRLVCRSEASDKLTVEGNTTCVSPACSVADDLEATVKRTSVDHEGGQEQGELQRIKDVVGTTRGGSCAPKDGLQEHGRRPRSSLRRSTSDVVTTDVAIRRRRSSFRGCGSCDDFWDRDRDREVQVGEVQQQFETRWSWRLRQRMRSWHRGTSMDNEESEWGQEAPTGRWRLWWPGRSRHITIGPYLESPAVSRVGCESSFFGRSSQGSRNMDVDVEMEMDRLAGKPPKHTRSLSTSGRLLGIQAKTGMDNCRTPGRDSLAQTTNTPSGVSKRDRRLRRWVSFSDAVGGGVSMETEARKWIINVLGSRAVGLMEDEGGVHESRGRSGKGLAKSLSEGLKDGKVLVRLAHAVGGKRTAGMAKELEASTPMLQLVNVHTFLSLARAIGVDESCLFQPKDLLNCSSSGRCSSAVLKCLVALSDTVRKNAAKDHPGDAYRGPLFGDVSVNASYAMSRHASKACRPLAVWKEGKEERGLQDDAVSGHGEKTGDKEGLVEEISTSPESGFSDVCPARPFSALGQST